MPKSDSPVAEPFRTSLAPISRRMVGDDVLDALRDAVIDGKFPPGERLAEGVLANEMRVSRAPVREALMQLEREGLISFDQRGTARVRELHTEDLEEIYTLRLTLEPWAARLAAERADETSLKSLDANIAATTRAKTLSEVSRLDAAFHEVVVRASGHKRLAQCWSGLGQQVLMWLMRMQREHQAVTKRTREQTAEAHAELLRALRSRSGDEAAAAMHRHIIDWREWLPLQEK